jgi:demethylmacrocin O-methyltransferase
MWRTYFPRALLFGLDINDKVVSEPRITFVRGSQIDRAVLERLVKMAGGSFDIVIDDGSHINEHVRTTFDYLFPHVSSGGLYVIEDLETAYVPEVGGGPAGSAGTSVALAKDLVDGVNRRYIPAELFTPTVTQTMVKAAHFYPNIVFLEKE